MAVAFIPYLDLEGNHGAVNLADLDPEGRGQRIPTVPYDHPESQPSRYDLSGLEALIKPGQDGEGVDVDAVLRKIKEDQEKYGGKKAPSPPAAGAGDSRAKTKYILYWNSAYGSRQYGFCCGRDPFEESSCPVSDCYATDNRSLLAGGPSAFDAVLFHQREMSTTDLPESRRSEQKYIMFMLESPMYPMGFESSKWNSFFNWTLTYRRDSDFPMLYGRIEQTKPHPTDEVELQALISNFGKSNAHLARKKKNKAAWFVSNCHSMSHRERYVAALGKHFDVDIFGSCGDKSCRKDREEDCWRMVDRDYKFYLSFENSICADYITEKFFNAVDNDTHVIPVVLGGGDYAAPDGAAAPPHSHLSVHERDFEDPKALAREMSRLASDDSAFAEFFWWRDYYRVVHGKAHLAKTFCDVCAALHGNQGAPSRSYDDLEEWWEGRSKCRKLRQRFL